LQPASDDAAAGGHFVGDALQAPIDIVRSHADIVLCDLIALVNGVSRCGRCGETQEESTDNDKKSAK